MIMEGRSTHRLPQLALALLTVPPLLFAVTARSADCAPPDKASAHTATADEPARHEEILLGRVSCDVVGGTLAEFVAQVSGGSEPARIVLDEAKLREDCRLTAATPVTLQAQQIRRQSALAIVLGPHGAGFYVKDGTIHITSLGGVEASEVVARRYYVADLATSRWGRAMGQSGGNASLVEFITSTVQPHSWERDNADASIRESADHRYLEVRHSVEAHKELARLLEQLREMPATGVHGKSLVGQIRARHSFRFVAKPLAEVARQISATYDVNIHLDEAALRKRGLSHETPVTWQAENATLGQSLDRLLEPLSLSYVVENEVIKITSDRSDQVVTVTYNVYDLLRPVRRASGEIKPSDFAPLIDRIKQEAAPGTWGNPGEITAFPNNLSLVISHNELGHESVNAFLTNLRKSTLGGSPDASRE
jgi:hypothetical protein